MFLLIGIDRTFVILFHWFPGKMNQEKFAFLAVVLHFYVTEAAICPCLSFVGGLAAG